LFTTTVAVVTTFEDVAAAKDQLAGMLSFNNIQIQMVKVLNNKNKRLIKLNSLEYFKRKKNILGVQIKSLYLCKQPFPFSVNCVPDSFCVGRFRDFKTVYSVFNLIPTLSIKGQ
jgi:hypothetical protein